MVMLPLIEAQAGVVWAASYPSTPTIPMWQYSASLGSGVNLRRARTVSRCRSFARGCELHDANLII